MTYLGSSHASDTDCGICSAELLPDISYFKVGDYIPWLSDHTPISHSLMLRESSIQDRKQTTTSKLDKLPPQFHWNSTASEQFTRTLKSSQNKATLEDINRNLMSDDLETTIAILQANMKAMLKQSGISLDKHLTHKK